MSAAVLTTPQEALDARYTAPHATVFVGGVTVPAIDWDCKLGTDTGLATARIMLSLPRPAAVVANAPVEIVGGHNDLAGTFFSGRIPRWESLLAMQGATVTIHPVGWTSLLAELDLYELSYDGPIAIAALFDSLCARRGIPSYRADPVLDPTGTVEVMLGGNPNVDDGKVIIPTSQSPLAYLNSQVETYGYRIYDTCDGTVRLSRVSGLPNTTPVVTFTEGYHLHTVRSTYDIGGIVNWPDIQGQNYEDQYGASVPIRAFPAAITSDPLIPVNGGVRKVTTRNSYITTLQQAEIALAVAQIDGNAPSTPIRWDAVAVPGLSVGDAVTVDASAVEVDGDYWLTQMTVRYSDRGLTAAYDGWAGAGTALPAGDDSTEIAIQTSPIHLGNETLSHYAVPSPSGTSATWNITIPDRATAVNVRGLGHGANSQIVNGAESDLEVTKWQVWSAGTTNFTEAGDNRPEASGNMPVMPENLAQRLPYSNIANWARFAINLGRLEAGNYVLRLVSGVKSDVDDFEVRDVVLEVFGIAEPVVLPQEVT